MCVCVLRCVSVRCLSGTSERELHQKRVSDPDLPAGFAPAGARRRVSRKPVLFSPDDGDELQDSGSLRQLWNCWSGKKTKQKTNGSSDTTGTNHRFKYCAIFRLSLCFMSMEGVSGVRRKAVTLKVDEKEKKQQTLSTLTDVPQHEKQQQTDKKQV